MGPKMLIADVFLQQKNRLGQKSEQSLLNKVIKNAMVTGPIEFYREFANGKLLFC
jgi:hypothetical protein